MLVQSVAQMIVDLHVALELLKEWPSPVSVLAMDTVEPLRLAHQPGWPGRPPQRHQVGIGAEPVAIFRHRQHALKETARPGIAAGRRRGYTPRPEFQDLLPQFSFGQRKLWTHLAGAFSLLVHNVQLPMGLDSLPVLKGLDGAPSNGGKQGVVAIEEKNHFAVISAKAAVERPRLAPA